MNKIWKNMSKSKKLESFAYLLLLIVYYEEIFEKTN
jgi:hypothetical protein